MENSDRLYHELLRPQFHFSAQKNWLNDPNGLVYYQGIYHMFFQFNAKGIEWGPNSWGHAVSRDLVHWKQLADALDPDDYGHIWSGSAVVDWQNTAGFKAGDKDALVAVYTTGSAIYKTPTVQALAYSTDGGTSWMKYAGNPVLGHIRAENRDPKVIWHAPTQQWVMALYIDQNDYALFASPDLKQWQHLCPVHLSGASECPDFFPLPVDGNVNDLKWVFWGGNGGYLVGQFDGEKFTPEQNVQRCELGTNGYAAQTWSDIPAEDGRRIQISWMRSEGIYAYMPFNQQMSFPVTLELRRFPEGLRLCRQPTREIELLNENTHTWENIDLSGGKSFIPETRSDLFDVRAVIEPGSAEKFGVLVHGNDLRIDLKSGVFTYLGNTISLGKLPETFDLRLLIDRTSFEIFVQDGKYSASFCFLPRAKDFPLSFYAAGGSMKLAFLTVHALRSAWD